FCRCCCGASTLAKNPRCPANTNLHTIRMRNPITDRIAGAIKFRRRGDGLPQASDSALCQRSLTLPAGFVSPAASARSAACDGMNHQDFILLARYLLEAFTGRLVISHRFREVSRWIATCFSLDLTVGGTGNMHRHLAR